MLNKLSNFPLYKNETKILLMISLSNIGTAHYALYYASQIGREIYIALFHNIKFFERVQMLE